MPVTRQLTRTIEQGLHYSTDQESNILAVSHYIHFLSYYIYSYLLARGKTLISTNKKDNESNPKSQSHSNTQTVESQEKDSDTKKTPKIEDKTTNHVLANNQERSGKSQIYPLLSKVVYTNYPGTDNPDTTYNISFNPKYAYSELNSNVNISEVLFQTFNHFSAKGENTITTLTKKSRTSIQNSAPDQDKKIIKRTPIWETTNLRPRQED